MFDYYNCNFFPTVWSEIPMFQLVSVTPHHIPMHFWDKSGYSQKPLIRYLDTKGIVLNSSLNNINSSTLISHTLCSSPLPTLTVFFWAHFSTYLDTEHYTWSHKHRTEVKNHFAQPTDYILANPLCGWTSLPPSCSTCSSLGHEVLFLLGCFISSQSPDCMYGCMELHSPGCRTWHLPQLSFKKFLPGHLFLWPTKIPFCIAAPSSSVLKPPPTHTFF